MYFYVYFVLFGLLFGAVLDVGHILKSRVVMQGGMDASVLAGTMQNHEVITQIDAGGAPTQFDWQLNTDSSPETVATQTWNKNVQNWTATIGMSATPFFIRTADQKGIIGSTMEGDSLQQMGQVENGWFGAGSAPSSTVNVQVSSQAHLP